MGLQTSGEVCGYRRYFKEGLVINKANMKALGKQYGFFNVLFLAMI